MRVVPGSLGGRLLAGGAVFTLLALVIATGLIGAILYRFIIGQIDQRLDLEIATIAGAVTSDGPGPASLAGVVDVPPFDRIGSGWYWQVEGEGVAIRSASLANGTLDRPPSPPSPVEHRGPPPPPPDIVTDRGEALHVRSRTVLVGKAALTITATAPRSAITAPLRDALVPLAASILAIALALLGASLVQVRIGLRPLARLSDDLRAVRAGRADRVPSGQPAELAPVVAELNALLDQNAASLASARLHVANLAHGLKTPLASLAVELSGPARDPTGSLRPLVEQMERSIRHHLGRARAAAAGGPARASVLLAPRIGDLVAALGKIHADRGVDVAISIEPSLAVACEGQDFDEMLGNLLDNAFQWANSSVRIAAEAVDRSIVLSIVDDGPGLSQDLMRDVLLPGRRADETMPGHGFGLSITRELAELYGGSLQLSPHEPRGLRAELWLPAAISHNE